MTVRLKTPLLPCETEALALLENARMNGQKIMRPEIVRTDSESILFSSEGGAFTAWKSADGRSILRVDRGFVAEFE